MSNETPEGDPLFVPDEDVAKIAGAMLALTAREGWAQTRLFYAMCAFVDRLKQDTGVSPSFVRADKVDAPWVVPPKA